MYIKGPRRSPRVHEGPQGSTKVPKDPRRPPTTMDDDGRRRMATATTDDGRRPLSPYGASTNQEIQQ